MQKLCLINVTKQLEIDLKCTRGPVAVGVSCNDFIWLYLIKKKQKNKAINGVLVKITDNLLGKNIDITLITVTVVCMQWQSPLQSLDFVKYSQFKSGQNENLSPEIRDAVKINNYRWII